MKQEQAPHLKLSDEEVRELILDVVFELNEVKENLVYELEQIEMNLNRLKRHFCPEKFQIFTKELADCYINPQEINGRND